MSHDAREQGHRAPKGSGIPSDGDAAAAEEVAIPDHVMLGFVDDFFAGEVTNYNLPKPPVPADQDLFD